MPVIYLDHMSATPLRPECLAAMQEVVGLGGNPSSPHGLGRAARRLVEAAADHVRQHWHAPTAEVLWTGSDEARALAVLGLARAQRAAHGQTAVVVAGAATAAAARCFTALRAEGFTVHTGWQARAPLPPGTALITLDAVNERGEMQPLNAVCEAARRHGIPVHADVSVGADEISCDFAALGLDACSFSGHKLGGPAGVGAVILRKGLTLAPLWEGGGQQRGMRPGTEPLVLVVGLGQAVASLRSCASSHAQWCTALRHEVAATADTFIMAAAGPMLPGVVCIGVHGTFGVAVARDLAGHGVMVASIDAEQEQGVGAVRLSMGWNTTLADVRGVIAAWRAVTASLGEGSARA